MRTRFLIIVAFFVFAAYTELEAYGHGVGSRFNAGFYRVEGETFSTTTVSVGESFFINGTIVSLIERDIQGNMDVRLDYANNDSWLVNLLKSNLSCLGEDMSTGQSL